MQNKYRATYRDSTGIVTQVLPSPLSLEQAREWMKEFCERRGYEYIRVEKT